MRLPAFLPRSDWKPTPVAQLPSWAGAKRIGIDLETNDPDLKKMGPGVRRNGKIVGIAFAIEDGPEFYLPIGHMLGNNLDREVVFRYLRDQAKNNKFDVVGANLQYDMDFLAQQGVEFWHCRFRDVQNAEPLLDELRDSYSLESIASYHGMPGKDEGLLKAAADCYGIHSKRDLWKLPPEFVGPYGGRDARLPLQLLRRQERMIEDQELGRVYDLECRLQPILLRMRRKGVRIDMDKLDQVETWALSKEAAALKEITRLTGIKLDTGDTTKTASLVPVLHSIGLEVPKLESGKDSLTKEILESLDHPVAELIRQARKFNKVRRTFVQSLRDHQVNGRIHCTFNQLRTPRDDEEGGEENGARYGRLSCVMPNLQQQPSRDKEIGPLWRSVYVPDEGGAWACLDYSQQEPRWATSFAERLAVDPKSNFSEKARESAIAAAERYRNDPTTDNHQMMADLCKIPRSPAKEIYLGKIYGMGGAKLCSKLGLPTEWRVKWKQQWLPMDHPEAKVALMNGARKFELAGPEGKAIIDKFNEGAPFLLELAKSAENAAKRRGYVITAGGRRCRFPKKKDGTYDWTHKALNRIVQGSSGDQTKMAMVLAGEADVPLQLQVHDELDLTVYSPSEVKQLNDIMMEALPCRVPAKVDVEQGPSWGEIK